MILRRVEPMSAAKIMGALNLVLGLIMGCIIALISMMFGGVLAQAEGGAMLAMISGVGAIIILPVLYGIFGFLTGLIGAAIYNGIAGMVGGIQLDLQ